MYFQFQKVPDRLTLHRRCGHGSSAKAVQTPRPKGHTSSLHYRSESNILKMVNPLKCTRRETSILVDLSLEINNKTCMKCGFRQFCAC